MMMPLFLSLEEVWLLTGFKSKSKQKKRLLEQGLPFYLNANGVPRVPRILIESFAKNDKSLEKKRWKPQV